MSVVAVAASAFAGQIVSKKDALKTLFNGAQQALAIALAILAYRALGGVPLLRIGDSSSLSLFALFLVFFLSNSVCVAGVLGIVGQRSAWAIWKKNTFTALPYDFLFASGDSFLRLDVQSVWNRRSIYFRGAAPRAPPTLQGHGTT